MEDFQFLDISIIAMMAFTRCSLGCIITGWRDMKIFLEELGLLKGYGLIFGVLVESSTLQLGDFNIARFSEEFSTSSVDNVYKKVIRGY